MKPTKFSKTHPWWLNSRIPRGQNLNKNNLSESGCSQMALKQVPEVFSQFGYLKNKLNVMNEEEGFPQRIYI